MSRISIKKTELITLADVLTDKYSDEHFVPEHIKLVLEQLFCWCKSISEIDIDEYVKKNITNKDGFDDSDRNLAKCQLMKWANLV